jgi:hypothetical protein
MMAHRSIYWVTAVTASVLIAGPVQALEFQLIDSVVDLRFDEFGAIGNNFVNDTQLLGATVPPSSTATDVDMVFAGAVYLPQFNTVLGSSSLKGRVGITGAATTSTLPNSVSSRYFVSTGPDESRLAVQVDTSLQSPGLMHQTYTFVYRDIAGDPAGGDGDVVGDGLSLLIMYMLDPDIGTGDIDDLGSVASGTARAWDPEFANPGSATGADFNDPMIEMSAKLNGADPDELGTSGTGSRGMLMSLNTPIPLPTYDVDGPGDDDDGAYGARWQEIVLSSLNPTATLEVDIQFGGLIPSGDNPIPEPVTASLCMMALGSLAWRTSRRRGHHHLR